MVSRCVRAKATLGLKQMQNDDKRGSFLGRSFTSWTWNIGALMVLAAISHPIAFARADREWLLLDYGLVLFPYLGFFFEVPDMLARRTPPGDRPRAVFVLLAGLAPWLLAFIASDRLGSNTAIFLVFWPILVWSFAAILIAGRQDDGPASALTRAFLAVGVVVAAAAFAYPFVNARLPG